MGVYSAEEAKAWGDGYPLVEAIVLTLCLSKLGFLQHVLQVLLMAKPADFILYSVHGLTFALLNYF